MRTGLSEQEMEFIKRASSVFAQKWTIRIVSLLMSKDSGVGFNELMKGLDGISAAVLSNRLKRLQKLGYVRREVQIGPPTRTRYALTEKGRKLLEVADYILQHA